MTASAWLVCSLIYAASDDVGDDGDDANSALSHTHREVLFSSIKNLFSMTDHD